MRAQNKESNVNSSKNKSKMNSTIYLGAGCFWCVEAIFQRIKGVQEVQSGYMGGKISNPTYREVCSGLTGHAEVIKVVYDASVISTSELLQIFFETHDPTTLNKQGADEGTQYRSAIFYSTEEQKKIADELIKKYNDKNYFAHKIVTEVTSASVFYKAEDYHQNYFNLNGEQPYCKIVIQPKVKKFLQKYADKNK